MKKIEPIQTADGTSIDSTDHSADAPGHTETNYSGTTTSSPTDPETSMNAAAISDAERLLAADVLVRNHALVAAGIGFIPMPVIDAIALTGTQLKLLKSLGELYDQNFSEEYVKKTIASLINGYVPLQMAPVVASAIKFVPFFGQAAGALSMATLGAGITYGIGKVFIRHFESGGTFLTFDAQKAKDYFKSQFKVGAKLAASPKSVATV
jgi:uncharacterized protein (DUF697 family)